MSIQLLFLCGDRRVTLLRKFREALQSASNGGLLLATDTVNNSSSSFVVDKCIRVPACNDNSAFVEAVVDICREHQIDAIIPLKCIAVKTLPLLRQALPSVVICASDTAVATTVDKVLTTAFFEHIGLKTPRIIAAPTRDDLPVFHRARSGEGSDAAHIIASPEALTHVKSETPGLFTEYVEGIEFTVDIYKSRVGRIVSVVPRERLRIRAGEVEQAVVRYLPRLCKLATIAAQSLDFFGPANIQVIECRGEYYFTEFNLRFSGGVTLSIHAGMNSPEWLISDILGKPFTGSAKICWGTGMSRYDDDIYWRTDN